MSSRALTTGIMFALQTGVGILGNISLLFCHAFMSHNGQKLKDIDMIVKNLILANCLVLLTGGIPHTMFSLGMKNFLDDVGCKLVLYLHRVARGVSLGTTSILSCLQAMKISPRSPWWMKTKVTPVKFTGICIILCWTLHTLVTSVIINYVTGPRENNNHTNIQDLGYCSGILHGRNTYIVEMVIFSLIDVMSLGCMACSSGFMMLVLHKHKKNVLYIHRKTTNPKFSAETRATQSILTLASIFLCFYSLSSILTFYMTHFQKPSHWLRDITLFTAGSFPSLSPFVLSRDPRVSRLCFTCCAKISHFC